MGMTETEAGRDFPLQRWVGIGLGTAAILIGTINAIGAPSAIRADPIRLILSAQVGLVFLIGLLAFASAFVPRLRVLQFVLVIGTGFGAAFDTSPGQLTPFIWLLAGMLLGWEYGYFVSRGTLKAGAITGALLVIWIVQILGEAEFGFATVGISIVAASLLGVFGWLLIVLKQRELKRRQQQLEDAVVVRTSELADALTDQQLLLAELHHRTKNNLQLVSSMLMFEEHGSAASELATDIQSAQRRIHALGRVHDLLYAKTDVNDVDITSFIADYLDAVTLMVDSLGVEVRQHLEAHIRVRTDLAIRIGLMLNEIVFNSIEHAGGLGNGATIDVRLRSEGNDLVLIAYDDGPGISGTAEDRMGIGIQIVESMAGRLGGSAVMSAENGTRWTVRLPLDRRESKWD